MDGLLITKVKIFILTFIGISKDIPTIVYFHENDYDPPTRIYTMKQYYDTNRYANQTNMKYNVIMIDYRGYGLSEGTPTEDGIMLDSLAILEHVFTMTEIDQNQIYVLGCSLGGAPAIYSSIKYQHKLQGLILQNTIQSVEHLMGYRMPFLKPILPYFLRVHLPNIDRIKSLTLPIMFIISINDKNTGSEGMYKLFHEATNAVYRKMYDIDTDDHYLPYFINNEEYTTKVMNFIQTCSNKELQKEHHLSLKELRAKEAIESAIPEDKKEDL